MKKNTADHIENISLSAKQIKNKLEDSLAYDHNKYKNLEILFATKVSQTEKLPFSSYKISISEEMYGQQLLLEDIKKHIEETKLIEEQVEVEVEQIIEDIEEEIIVDEPVTPLLEDNSNQVNIIEEICEFDEIVEDDEEFDDEDDEDDESAQLPSSARAKKPKGYTIKIVDIEAVIKKIKDEARIKNEGKPVISRRQINKLLKPYLLKQRQNMDNIDGIDNALTSIDIYLNAVDKIANTSTSPLNKNSNDSLELNLNDILEDLEK